ncbi:MAG: hypothetical protein ABEJ79_07695 [Halolamina sp.]
MPTIDEKRVYSDAVGATPVYVASDLGVVRATVSDDLVGEFGVARRGEAADVAFDGVLAVAADDVRVGPEFAPTGFGATVAVGCHRGAVLATDETGRVARLPASAVDRASAAHEEGGGDTGDEESAPDAVASAWTDLGRVEEVRALDGPLVAAADGVCRAREDDLAPAGLGAAEIRDVAGHGAPLAATDGGLYALANGWVVADEAPTRTVDAAGDRAHAAGESGIVARDDPGGSFAPVAADFEPVGFAHLADGVVAATADGTLHVTVGDDWRSRSVGVRGVSGVAAVTQASEQ